MGAVVLAVHWSLLVRIRSMHTYRDNCSGSIGRRRLNGMDEFRGRAVYQYGNSTRKTVPRVYGKNVSVLKIISISSVLYVRFMVARSTWWYTGRAVPGQFKCRTFKRGSLFFRFDLDVSFPIVPAVLFVWILFSTPFPKENVSPFWTVYAINLPEQTRLSVSDDPVRDRMQISRAGSFHVCINFVCTRSGTPPERAESLVPCRFCAVHNNNGKHAPSSRSNNRRGPVPGDLDGIEKKMRLEWDQVSLLSRRPCLGPPAEKRTQCDDRCPSARRAKIFCKFLK